MFKLAGSLSALIGRLQSFVSIGPNGKGAREQLAKILTRGLIPETRGSRRKKTQACCQYCRKNSNGSIPGWQFISFNGLGNRRTGPRMKTRPWTWRSPKAYLIIDELSARARLSRKDHQDQTDVRNLSPWRQIIFQQPGFMATA